MKILHILSSGEIGGIERLLCNYLSHSDHDNFFYFFWDGGIVADEIVKMGGRVKIEQKKKTFFVLLRTLLSMIKKHGIGVVIVHHASPMLRIALLVLKALFPSIKTIAYAHGHAYDICEVSRRKGLAMRKVTHKIVFRNVDGVIAISNTVKNSLIEYLGVPAGKIKVIYNGVPIEKGDLKFSDSTCAKIVFVGRLVEIKGVQIILKALGQISQQYDFVFDIVGDGVYSDELKRITKELSLDDKVNFWGMRNDVSEFLRDRDIFVHMPICDEGFGIAVVEAMDAGCICICASKGGIPEIITDGVDGYIVNSSSAEELASILSRVIPEKNNETHKKMRQNAVNRAVYFSISQFSDEFNSYINEI